MSAIVPPDALLQKHQNALYRAKMYQMLFHWFMATLTLQLTPTEILTDPMQATETAYQAHHQDMDQVPKPLALATLYLLNTTYSCILYFWDPVEATPLRLYHLLSIFLGTLFAALQQSHSFLMVLCVTYVIDSCVFVSRLQASERSAACLRSMMKVHHMATLMLMAVSWMYGAHFYGVFVMFLHDITDVSMFVVRLLRQRPDAWLHAKQLFVVPVLLWTWTYHRIYVFGQLIFAAMRGLAWPGPDSPRHVADNGTNPLAWVCITGMLILWSFNIYWTLLVAKKAWKSLVDPQSGAGHDDNE